MAIRVSSSKQIDALIRDLAGSDEVQREAAIARLTVIGDRALERLIALSDTGNAAGVRVAALRALEGIGQERALAVALKAVGDPDSTIASAGINLTRLFLKGPRGSEAVDRLTALALDASKPGPARVAAVGALRELEPKTIRPLLEKLSVDPNGELRAAALPGGPAAAPGGQKSERDRGAREAPEGVREWLAREGARAPLTSLLELVERAARREAAEPVSRRGDWTAVRFATHLVLARRNSRIALYDIRESLERAKAPLPADAVAALTLIGDASCVEAIAAAYARSHNAEWRRQLLEAFHVVTKRAKLTPRHAVMRRIQQQWPTFARG